MRTLVGATAAALIITTFAAPPALLAQQKTAKECRQEWRVNKDANKKAGVTEKDYVAKCRGAAGTASTQAPAAGSATSPAAQVKTAKECREEWRANKDANKKAGVTEKDYVAKCRGGEAAASAAAPAAPSSGANAPEPAGRSKTAKACRDEWRANRESNRAAGVTEKDYVANCRAGGTASRSAQPPAAPSQSAAAPAQAPARSKSAPAPQAAPTGANQYASEAQAKARCPADTVVWANADSKVYHFSGHHNYGNTKDGAYMCERDAIAESFRAAENEKHP